MQEKLRGAQAVFEVIVDQSALQVLLSLDRRDFDDRWAVSLEIGEIRAGFKVFANSSPAHHLIDGEYTALYSCFLINEQVAKLRSCERGPKTKKNFKANGGGDME